MVPEKMLFYKKDNIVYDYAILEYVPDDSGPLADRKYKENIRLDGRRACPPEDCGGPWGYSEILETMKGKNSKKKKELVDWLGYDFDPEEFHADEVNDLLQ